MFNSSDFVDAVKGCWDEDILKKLSFVELEILENLLLPCSKELANQISKVQMLIDEYKMGRNKKGIFSSLKRIRPLPDQFNGIIMKSVDRRLINHVFAEGGALQKKLPNYEERREQKTMSRGVAWAINRKKYLVSEAGAGVGKSWAYLVPSILFSTESMARVVVSTNTKNLQDQLIERDIPFLKTALNLNFKATVAKGRGNYLCLLSFAQILSDSQGVLPHLNIEQDIHKKAFLIKTLFWIYKTERGEISEISQIDRGTSDYELREELSNRIDLNCKGKECEFFWRCFITRLRNDCVLSNIVVVNHSLLFTDTTSFNPIIPSHNILIIDEAHNLERTARDAMSIQVSYTILKKLLKRLFYRDGRQERGLITRIRQRERLDPADIKEIISDIRKIDFIAKASFQSLEKEFTREVKIHSRERVQSNGNDKLRIRNGAFSQNLIIEFFQDLIVVWTQFFSRCNSLLKKVNDTYLKRDLERFIEKGILLLESLRFVANSNEENYVFWIERDALFVKISSSPIEVGEHLHGVLYDRMETVVFSSATLTVNRRFDYMSKNMGLDKISGKRLRLLLLGSSFDHKKQLSFNILTFLPYPQEEVFMEETSFLLEKLLQSTGGRSLVLFTSHRMLRYVYNTVKGLLGDRFLLLGQGIDGYTSAITDQFRRDVNSVLLGTQSLWEGVDLPGETLEYLVLVRLPFPVPTDPLEEARAELLRSRGENPFLSHALPSAVLKFRQGFGRLIRHKEDKGMVIVFDKRILLEKYGKEFIASLPIEGYNVVSSFDDLKNRIEEWKNKDSVTFKSKESSCESRILND